MSTPTAAAPTACDTQDMVIVHRMFRRLFEDGPALVRVVAPGADPHRRAVVDHLLRLCSALRNHHTTEDDNLWNRLSARAPGCSIHVALMRRQHTEMADHLRAAEAALAAWRGSGSAADAEASEEAMTSVLASLRQHLSDEERRILPEAARVMTQKEWDVIGRAARKEAIVVPDFVAKLSPWVQLGLMLDGLNEQQLRETRRILPAPALLLYRLVGARKFAAYRADLWGTAA